jgi:hypothetical protein
VALVIIFFSTKLANNVWKKEKDFARAQVIHSLSGKRADLNQDPKANAAAKFYREFFNNNGRVLQRTELYTNQRNIFINKYIFLFCYRMNYIFQFHCNL